MDVPKLTEDQQQAVQVVTEGNVRSTVSFLASDEMAGRNTPSKELTIATAYVASRFLGAGLEGLGDDGGFYQSHNFALSQPSGEVALSVDDSAIKVLGCLNSAPEEIEFSDVVVSEKDALKAKSSRIALIDELIMPPQASSRPGLVVTTLARRLRALTAKGVDVVLMSCSEQSVLLQVADQLQKKPISNRAELRPKCAVILVKSTEQIVGKNMSVKTGAQQGHSAAVRNVVGVLRGSDDTLKQQAVLVSAHLDHLGTKPVGEDRINNGADDNASGVTAVLALADAFSSLKQRPKRSIVFATFWGEEKGLLGSKQYAAHPTWPLEDIVANINIEMVGRPETNAREKSWMTGWKHSNLGPLMNAGAQRLGVEIFNREDVGEMLYTRGDNYSFVNKGVVAHSFSAGSLHSDYHQPSDEWEKLDIPHMTKVIHGFYGGILVVSGDVELTASRK